MEAEESVTWGNFASRPRWSAIWLKSLITLQTLPAARNPLDDLRQASKHSARELGPPAEHARAAAVELRPDLRSFPFKGYVIFFRYLDDEILQVVHIIEGHPDVAVIFAKDDGV